MSEEVMFTFFSSKAIFAKTKPGKKTKPKIPNASFTKNQGPSDPGNSECTIQAIATAKAIKGYLCLNLFRMSIFTVSF
jgi:hypothetical protein